MRVVATALVALVVTVPHAARGQKVTVVARHVPTPTAFAFGFGKVFVAGYGSEDDPNVRGGVYVLGGGKAVRLGGSPAHASGLAFRDGTLYVSGGPQILAWSGWNGTSFAKRRVVATGPPGFYQFGGLAFRRDGVLYAGVANAESVEPAADHAAGKTPYADDVLTVDVADGTIRVLSTGIRQPWQLLFVPGHAGPIVSDLGQDDLGAKRPPDWLIEATPGADFGFPACPAAPAACATAAKPFVTFPPHTSPMGLAYLDGKLYVALFNGLGNRGPLVVTMPPRGGRLTTFLSGFDAGVIALGASRGRIYAGDHAGTIYSVKP